MTSYAHPIQYFHAQWAADPTLNGLLPATRLTTGRAKVATTFPYATITPPDETPNGVSNNTYYDHLTIRIQVWSTSFQVGAAIHRRIYDLFRNADCTLDNGSVLNIHPSARGVIEEQDEVTERVWQFINEFTCQLAISKSSSGA